MCRDPRSPRPAACDDSRCWAPLEGISISLPTPAAKERLRSTGLALRYRAKNYVRWIRAVVIAAERLHRSNPFHLVYSRSLPMEAHIAGYWASRRLRLPWIANINDPWDWHLMPGEMRIRGRLADRWVSSFWMRKTLQKADLVTYPSARLRDYHLRLCGVNHESAVIPHIGYALEGKGRGGGGFRLVHAGKLGGLETRSPVSLLEGIGRFLRRNPEARSVLKALFVGLEDPATRLRTDELGLHSVVEHTGRVSYEKSLEFISSAAVCVLVEGDLPEGIFLPSKLADYLVAGKPVLSLSPALGVVGDLCGRRGLTRVDIGSGEGVEAAIDCYYRAFRSGRIDDMGPAEDLRRPFEPGRVAELFRAKVEKVLGLTKPAGHIE